MGPKIKYPKYLYCTATYIRVSHIFYGIQGPLSEIMSEGPQVESIGIIKFAQVENSMLIVPVRNDNRGLEGFRP